MSSGSIAALLSIIKMAEATGFSHHISDIDTTVGIFFAKKTQDPCGWLLRMLSGPSIAWERTRRTNEDANPCHIFRCS